eukprot:scaffold11075_cov132-Isochrysis_galbana.AAC.4
MSGAGRALGRWRWAALTCGCYCYCCTPSRAPTLLHAATYTTARDMAEHTNNSARPRAIRLPGTRLLREQAAAAMADEQHRANAGSSTAA